MNGGVDIRQNFNVHTLVLHGQYAKTFARRLLQLKKEDAETAELTPKKHFEKYVAAYKLQQAYDVLENINKVGVKTVPSPIVITVSPSLSYNSREICGDGTKGHLASHCEKLFVYSDMIWYVEGRFYAALARFSLKRRK